MKQIECVEREERKEEEREEREERKGGKEEERQSKSKEARNETGGGRQEREQTGSKDGRKRGEERIELKKEAEEPKKAEYVNSKRNSRSKPALGGLSRKRERVTLFFRWSLGRLRDA